MNAPYSRLTVLSVFLMTGLVLLGYPLVNLQVLRHDYWQKHADDNTHRTIAREPIRGQILDIRGNPLAYSSPVKTICADPTMIAQYRLIVAHALAPLLHTNENFLIDRLTPRLVVSNGKTNVSKYALLARRIPIDTWNTIKETMAKLPLGIDEKHIKAKEQMFYWALHNKSIFSEEDQIRTYPNHNLAAHVVGFVAADELQSGLSGIEASFNKQLSGIRGWRTTEMDKRNRELVAYRDQDVEAQDGLNVVLTLDARLQNIAETELAVAMAKHQPISASCTIVRPKTGEILAMATLPNFDPNRPGAFPPEALRNRVISDISEPGSTFKIVVISGGLNEHIVRLTDQVNCENGHFAFAGKILHDHKASGILSIEEVITKSSNIGAAKVGIMLGEDRLISYIHRYGFGTRTGIALPAEVNGIVHPIAKWSKVSIAQIPMGQGVCATPLQMVMAMSAIANNGRLMRPMIVDRLEDGNGKVVAKYQPQFVTNVADTAAIKDMIHALKTVVTPAGTAKEGKMEHYTVAGKTGTAQKNENGQYIQKFFSSFIGFFPADDPELCISVVLDAPSEGGHYGGDTAAPIFKAIAEAAANYLNLKPDVDVPSANQSLITTASVDVPANVPGRKK